ncbi:MAG TPA: molybdopterin oxidoreductase, partial [Bacteroidetes bacterium]|nr:molybdopterin oxidoreductase [Bacteroidota bacterium]
MDSMNGKEPNYWRSLRELHDTNSVSEMKAHEFMAGVTDDFNMDNLSGMSRKQFLALLTASAAFAATGCSNYRDKGEIVPYTKKPEEIVPGVANYYASTCTGCSQSCGILIKTREGRPIKIDGNPDHPVNQGKICAKGQASILNLYDPYRLRRPTSGSLSGKMSDLSWKRADAEIRKQLEACTNSSKQIAIVTNPILSPSAKKLFAEFAAKYPTTKQYSYDFFNDENRRRAWQSCYGDAKLPVIAWERANVVLALESDFLGAEGDSIEAIRRFTDGRDVMKSTQFNRLYCVEGAMSLTGANADYRLRLRPEAQLEFVLALAHALVVEKNVSPADKVAPQFLNGYSLKNLSEKYGLSAETLTHLVDDLIENRGKSIIYAGDGLNLSVHVVVNYLNEVLGNTNLYEQNQAQLASATTTPDEFLSLVTAMKGGQVGMVIHWGTNPVYHLPRLLGYADALKSVPMNVSLSETEDETGALCAYVLPTNHAFESWGDYQTRTDVISLQQPVIAPLYETRQKEDILLTWMSADGIHKDAAYHDFMMSHWQNEIHPSLAKKVDFKSFWFAALHDGVVRDSRAKVQERRFLSAALESMGTPQPGKGISVALRPSYYMDDGRYANNGWLQELPHPVSKVV